MGVDYYVCPECGEVYPDCGDAWVFCEEMGHRVCEDCAEVNDDGEVNTSDCPVCIAESREVKVPVADTWLLVRNDRGTVIGHYDQLVSARSRRTALKPLPTTIVKVSAVEGCEYPE